MKTDSNLPCLCSAPFGGIGQQQGYAVTLPIPPHATSTNALLAALLLCLATLPMTVSAQADPSKMTLAYGVEYDWSNLDEDIDSLTGINLNGSSRTMPAASDAGLNLTVAQLSTGSSNIFVESAEDRTPTTIGLDGDAVLRLDAHDRRDHPSRRALRFALITEWVTLQAQTQQALRLPER